MDSFLRGEVAESKIEYRGIDVPDPPVDSIEELRERAVTQTTTAKANGEKTTEATVTVDSTNETSPNTSAEIDISKLDIRVGVIQKVWDHEEADKLFCEEIDIGEESPRQIASGLREYYKLEELQGRRVLVLANLKSRKMMGFSSHGMVLCAASQDGQQVQFVEPPEGAKIGERVMVEGYDGEPATENQVIKKKMLESIFPDLKTNADGLATYKSKLLCTSAGPCKPTLANANVA